MTWIGTLNMGRQAITRTSWLVDFIHTFDCQVLCLQEIDVNIFFGRRFVQELERHGLHVFLGESDDHCYTAAIVSRVPGKSIQLGVLEQSRYAAAIFEFESGSRPYPVVVTSVYGHAFDRHVATAYILDVAGELRKLDEVPWILLGDMNVAAEEDPLARTLAGGGLRSLDNVFGALPPTTKGHRRLDCGFSATCWALPLNICGVMRTSTSSTGVFLRASPGPRVFRWSRKRSVQTVGSKHGRQ